MYFSKNWIKFKNVFLLKKVKNRKKHPSDKSQFLWTESQSLSFSCVLRFFSLFCILFPFYSICTHSWEVSLISKSYPLFSNFTTLLFHFLFPTHPYLMSSVTGCVFICVRVSVYTWDFFGLCVLRNVAEWTCFCPSVISWDTSKMSLVPLTVPFGVSSVFFSLWHLHYISEPLPHITWDEHGIKEDWRERIRCKEVHSRKTSENKRAYRKRKRIRLQK